MRDISNNNCTLGGVSVYSVSRAERIRPVPSVDFIDLDNKIENQHYICKICRCAIDTTKPYKYRIGRGKDYNKKWLLCNTRCKTKYVKIYETKTYDHCFILTFERRTIQILIQKGDVGRKCRVCDTLSEEHSIDRYVRFSRAWEHFSNTGQLPHYLYDISDIIDGIVYFFCSPSCHDKFYINPLPYIIDMERFRLAAKQPGFDYEKFTKVQWKN